MEVKKQQHSYDHKTDTVRIIGGKPLKGTVSVQGSKNASLPILASLPLLPSAEIYNVPNLSDVHEMIRILSYLGADIFYDKGVVYYNRGKLENKTISEEFANKMRASSLFLGPLVSTFKEATIGMPGGCIIGSRPLDIHTSGLNELGVETKTENGFISAKGKKIKGEYTLPFPSVGASQNLISASVLSPGEVILNNIAIEPEVIELIDFLNAAGARIHLNSSNSVHIKGVKKLNPVTFSVQPDRIEAFTLLTAALTTRGSIKIKGCNPEHLKAPLQALAEMGVLMKIGKDSIKASFPQTLNGIKVKTGVYPNFPTDCQQQISVLMLLAQTPSIIIESVFNNRFKHLEELRKMGANVEIEGNVGVIDTSNVSSCHIHGYDLRGSASLINAGLLAQGATTVSGMEYLHRGYESYIEKLKHLGADIRYI